MKHFYEVNGKGQVVRLVDGHSGHLGSGMVVYASSPSDAADLHHRYISGECGLMGDVIVEDEYDPTGTFTYNGVIR